MEVNVENTKKTGWSLTIGLQSMIDCMEKQAKDELLGFLSYDGELINLIMDRMEDNYTNFDLEPVRKRMLESVGKIEMAHIEQLEREVRMLKSARSIAWSREGKMRHILDNVRWNNTVGKWSMTSEELKARMGE